MSVNKREENIQRLNELLANFEVAMMTTIQPRDGSLHSRPMLVQKRPFDGSLWFFSKFSSAKVDEVRAGSQVNLALTAPGEGRYLSISGAAYLIRERMQMEAVWDERYLAWFPRGLEEPDLALMRIDVSEAEIWDSGSGANGLSLKFH